MINLRDLAKADELAGELCKWQVKLAIVVKSGEEGGSGLGVTIQGTYQSDGFLDFMRPHALAYIAERIAALKQALIALGVNPED